MKRPRRQITRAKPSRAKLPKSSTASSKLAAARTAFVRLLGMAKPKAEELEATRNYWLKVERKTRGRYLHGAELAIAQHAYSSHTRALKSSYRPIGQPLNEYVEVPQTEWPDPPESATIPKITPSQLLETAIQLRGLDQAKPGAAIHALFPQARDLLIQAESYLQRSTSKSVLEAAFEADGVSFDEILRSNDKANEGLHLLPGITGGNGKGAERYKGLRGAIRDYYKAVYGDSSATPEKFIRRRFLPTAELVQIRFWHYRKKLAMDLRQRERAKKNRV